MLFVPCGYVVHCTGLHTDFFLIFPVRETSQHLWAICSSVWSPTHEEALPCAQVELPVCPLLFSSCSAPLKRACPSCWHSPSDTDILKVLLSYLFSRLNRPGSLSFYFPYKRDAPVLQTSSQNCTGHSPGAPGLLYWHSTPDVASLGLSREETYFLIQNLYRVQLFPKLVEYLGNRMHSFQQNFNKTALPSSSETYVLEKTECLHLTAKHSSLNNFGRSQWIAMGKKVP